MNCFSHYGKLKDPCKELRERYVAKPFYVPVNGHSSETDQLWTRIEEAYKYGLSESGESTLIYCLVESTVNGKVFPELHHIDGYPDAVCVAKYLKDEGVDRVGILDMPGMLTTLDGFVRVPGWKVCYVDTSYAGRFPQQMIVLECQN